MELSIFVDGIQHHNNVIHKAISDEGLYVMHEDGYSYTVGMKFLDNPDVIIFGHQKDVVKEMFQALYQAVKLRLVNLEKPTSLHDVFDPAPELFLFSEMEKRKKFYAARTYYGDWNFSSVNLTMDLHLVGK